MTDFTPRPTLFRRHLTALLLALLLPWAARAQAPIITRLNPTGGAVGSTFVVSGANLTGTTSVLLGGQPAAFRSVTATSLRVTVPPGASTHRVLLTTPGGRALSSAAFQVSRPSPLPAFAAALSGVPDVGDYAFPTVTDLDRDGLLDLLVGNVDGITQRYEQTTAGGTTFAAATLSGVPDVGSGAAPTVTDLDGDGLLDLLVGNSIGITQRFEQTTAGGTAFAAATLSGVPDVGDFAAPTVTDLDGNGLLDLLVGNAAGITQRYEQTTAGGTAFAAATLSGVPDVGSGAAPTVTDLDGDGQLDLLVGTNVGITQRYEQTTAGGTAFTVVTLSEVPNVGSFAVPTVTDLDGDGRLDLLVGNNAGNTQRFEQIPPAPTLSNLSPTSGPVGTSVTLTGSDLSGATAVSFAGTANNTVTTGLTVSGSGSSQTITVNVPAGAATGNVTVTTPGGKSSGLTFTVLMPPTITSFNPTSGLAGSTVTITGSNLDVVRSVRFGSGGLPTARFTSQSATSLTVVVPEVSQSGVLRLTSAANVAVNSTGTFTFKPRVPLLATLSPTGPLSACAARTLTAAVATPGFVLTGTGFNAQVSAVAVQPDGKVLVGGDFTSYDGTTRNHVARLNADGSLDATFAPTGTGLNDYVRSLAVQADGKVLVVGGFTSYNGTARNYVARLNADGSLDTSFAPTGTGFTSAVLAVAVQSNGQILVGGLFTRYNGTTRNYVARLNADGSLDTSFAPTGTGLNNFVFEIAVQADGQLLVGGAFTSYNGTTRSRVARLSATGALDASFAPTGSGFNSTVETLAVQANGKVLIGGQFMSYNGTTVNRVARLNANGTLDASFSGGAGFNSEVYEVAVQADGKVLVGGLFTSYNGTARNYVARLNADGSLDTSFAPTGTGLNSAVLAVAVQADGKILIGGTFTSYNGTTTNRVVRFKANGALDAAATPVSGATFTFAPDGSTANPLVTNTPGAYTATASYLGNASPASNAVTLTPCPAPTISSLSPTSGPVGTSVTITGSNLSGATGVSFNGMAATTFSVSSPTTATATVPAGATTGDVTITTAGGTSNGVSFTVTVPASAPVVSSLNPVSGPVGTSVTLTGTSFTGATSVSFNGVAATSFSVASATSITTTVPTGATTGNVTVTTPAGTAAGLLFTVTLPPPSAPVLASLSPTSGVVGTSVIITGSNLSGATGVSFNGTAGTISANSATSVTTVVPAGATTGSVTVTTPGGTSNGLSFTVTVSIPVPTISSLSPTSGTVGTSITISGTNLSGATGVSFGGTAATSISANTVGSVTAVVPAGATTGSVTVTTSGGTSNGLSFTVTVPALPDLVVRTGSLLSPELIGAGSYNSLTITGTGVAQLSGPTSVTSAVLVQDGGVLLTNCLPLTGAASFKLSAGATLYVCDAAGLSERDNAGAVQLTGTRLFSTGASYVYNGTGPQATGAGLPGEVRNLTTLNNSLLTLTAPVNIRQTLTIGAAGNLALNGQALTLLSDATGSALAVNSGTGIVTGTATVQRYIDPRLNDGLGYRHYAAPVSNATVADLATSNFTPVVNGAYNTAAAPGRVTPFPTVFGYDQSRVGTVTSNFAPFTQGWVSPQQLTDALVPGRGYTVNLSASQLVDFNGTLGNGPVALSLARTENPAAGWHLVGNPYPAPLDWSQVAPADRAGLDAAIYVVQSTDQYQSRYRSYVNGQSTSGDNNPLLATAQGFFVRVSAGQSMGSLTFRNSQRVTDYTTAQMTTFQRGTADARPALRLQLAGGGLTDNWVAYAQAGATAGFEGEFDAAKLANPSGLNLSSEAGSSAFAIDGQAAFTAATVLPLAVGVPTAGTYTLTAEQVHHLPANLTPFLRDAQTGARISLTPGTSYEFSIPVGQVAALVRGRFSVDFQEGAVLATKPASLAAQLSLYPTPTAGRVVLQRPAAWGSLHVQVYNSVGQLVFSKQLDAAEQTLDVKHLPAGVYTLRLTTAAGDVLSKRLIRQ